MVNAGYEKAKADRTPTGILCHFGFAEPVEEKLRCDKELSQVKNLNIIFLNLNLKEDLYWLPANSTN